MSSTSDTNPAETAESIPLASGPGHSRAEWEKAAAAVLRKAGRFSDDAPDAKVWEALSRTTLDGVVVTPLGTTDDLASARTTGRPARLGAWDVCARVDATRGTRAREEVMADLNGGVTSLWVCTDADSDLAVALGEVLLDIAPVTLDAPRDPVGAARSLLDLAAARGAVVHPASNLGADPIAASLRGVDADGSLSEVVDLARGAGVRAVMVDATVVHDLGASDAQELAYALAGATAYLRDLVDDLELSVADAAALIDLRLAASADQFLTIAKFRAARRLWARVLELSGADPETVDTRLHGVTSRLMMTRYDPWVNMLRTTVAAFAAGVGGADAVTVLPFDSALGVPDAFGRRIARNTSSLLIEESHVARVMDPAGGAYAVEKLTDDLAAAAWEEFGRIEAVGGIRAALADGSLRSRIDEIAGNRDREIARRKRPLTGLSEFPNLGETLPQREPARPGSWEVRSYGAAFEALRDDPAGAPVFLATMGTVAAHTARATFATNLFAAGGIEVVNPGQCDDPTAVVEVYRAAGAPAVACLAGTDAAYSDWGAALATALRDAGARWLVLAGRPVDGIDVDDTCAVGVDALEFLNRTREKLS